MATESFLVATLPRTADAAERVHLSLFVTHRLSPDRPTGKLGDFPNVADWTNRLVDARIELTGQSSGGATVQIPVTAELDVLQPGLWPCVFPDSLEVRPWQTPDPTSVDWRTFAAHRMQQHALLTHAAAVLSSPVASPSVRGNALTRPLLSALGLNLERRLTVEQLLDEKFDLDAGVTKLLDDYSGEGFLGKGIGPGAEVLQTEPLLLMTTDVHRARRFYQRPEEQHPYRAVPKDGAKPVPVAKPKPDFHERASMLGDLSPLLRRLGLVIDLHIDNVSLLAGIVKVWATIEVPGLDNPVKNQPATACAVAGTDFYATSSSGDYSGPLLRLGDEERFRVLDLDPDAAALKLEQYVRNVPRLLASETNGDPTSSAPPTLRATGFGLARVDRAQEIYNRLQGAPARDAQVLSGTSPPMRLEDLARGIRLEVWDDVSEAWHSLHRRRIDVEVEGEGLVLDNEADTGFLQGAALTRLDGPDGGVPGTPYHSHEVLAGWDGWSLAAPRPGKVAIHDKGKEKLQDAPDPDPNPVNPVATTSRIEPLTLPWLRYGRRYAFRAWAVDLAGNSAPHKVAGPSGGNGGPANNGERSQRPQLDSRKGRDRIDVTARRVAEARLSEMPIDATTSPDRSGNAGSRIREALRLLHPMVEPGPREKGGPGGLDLSTFAPTGFEEVDDLVSEHLARRRDRRPIKGPARRERIEASFNEQIAGLTRLLERTDAQTKATTYAKALATAALSHPGLESMAPAVIATLTDLVTTPRPFLRWDPVIEPVVVPRHPYTEAESLLTLVIRSGVEGPAGDDGLELEIVPPETYSADIVTAYPDLKWRRDSQRHIAPPKSSQLEAELHGMFDAAIGKASDAKVRAALGVALRESGTFLDTTIADLSNPGAHLPQPGIAFHSSPTAEAPAAASPQDLDRGEPLTPGQYVVHDADQLVVPYLPDALATGLSMVFPDAGSGHHLFGLFATEGVNLRYRSAWPEPKPYRMVLESGDRLTGRVDEGTIRFRLPPGEQLRMNLSSSMDRSALDLLGLWQSLPAVLRNIDVIAEAAADGWFWWLTPSVQIRLVHAVSRPVKAPRATVLLPFRVSDDTSVTLVGGVDLHGPSTERLDIEAAWSEWVDDVTKPKPERIDVVAAVAHTTVRYEEDLVILANKDKAVTFPDGSEFHVHEAIHQFGDTKHRDVGYRMRATTRYREYFDPRVLPTPDEVSVLGPERELDVPSTARPAKPIVHDVLPLFRWYEETEPEQPFGLRRTRRTGLRLYLERPWYSSGDGELLGVLLAFGSDVPTRDHVSQWGSDPVFWQQGPEFRSLLPLVDFAHLIGLDDRRESGRPVEPPVLQRLVDVSHHPPVWVFGYEPEFSTERGMWFVDVAIDPGSAIWPFVRLVVARYQPSSLAGRHLSPVVRCDFVPLPPERTATLTRPDKRSARVVVTGPVGALAGLSAIHRPDFLRMVNDSRFVRVRLEREVTNVKTDLGWQTVVKRELPILGIDGTVVSWSGEIELPASLPPRRPGSSKTWRVVVEEWERFPADRDPVTGTEGVEARMVYADHLPL